MSTSADSPSSFIQRLKSTAWHNRRILIVAVCAIVFIVALQEALENELTTIDRMAWAFFVDHLRADWLTPHMEALSNLASPIVLLTLLLMIVAFAPGRRPGGCCALNLVLVVLLNLIIKEIIQRPRPEGINLVLETGFSFPSGHSMVAMAFFGLLIWLVWTYEENPRVKWFSCVCFALIIVAMGISRIYLGVHYATDVLGGFCVSLVWLVIYTKTIAPMLLREPDTSSADQPKQLSAE